MVEMARSVSVHAGHGRGRSCNPLKEGRGSRQVENEIRWRTRGERLRWRAETIWERVEGEHDKEWPLGKNEKFLDLDIRAENKGPRSCWGRR